jgi:Flagellar hook-length control protein FliK
MIRSIENVDKPLQTVVGLNEEKESSSSGGQEFSEVLASLLGRSRTKEVSTNSIHDDVLRNEFAEIKTTQEIRDVERPGSTPYVEQKVEREEDKEEKEEVVSEQVSGIQVDDAVKVEVEKVKTSPEGVNDPDIFVHEVEVQDSIGVRDNSFQVQVEGVMAPSPGIVEGEKVIDTPVGEVVKFQHDERHVESVDDPLESLTPAVQSSASHEMSDVQEHEVDKKVVAVTNVKEDDVVQNSATEDIPVSQRNAEATVNEKEVHNVKTHSEAHETHSVENEEITIPTDVHEMKQSIRDAIQSAEKIAGAFGGRTGFLSASIKPVGENALTGLSTLREHSRSDRQARYVGSPLLPYEAKTLRKVEQALKDAVWKNGKLVELRLDPPELGTIKLRVQIKDGGLHTTLRAESQEVTNLLRDKAYELQGLLRGLGLDFEKVTVSVYSDEQSASLSYNMGGGGSSSFHQQNNLPETPDDFSSLTTKGHGDQGKESHINRAIQEDHWVA